MMGVAVISPICASLIASLAVLREPPDRFNL
jgi:hypothetical protein